MAHSSIIGQAKNKIIKEFIKDAEIVNAIGAIDVDINSTEKLVGTHIFNYHQNPHTINTVGTFITIQVHISRKSLYDQTYITPTVEIWIISHEDHMKVDNVDKITDNRNDYLSRLIDNRLNGKSGFGIGELTLVVNEESSYQKNYVYRRMVFEGTDLNKSLCYEE